MRAWHQGVVESGPTRLRYFRSGGDLPPLVLVHGFTDTALYFTRTAEALCGDYDVVAYDARGHGLSTRLKQAGGRFDDDVRVGDLLEVVRQLDLDRPALIGHSMGAATIGRAAAEHQTLARAIVLEDPAWWEPTNDQITLEQDTRSAHISAWRTWVAHIQNMSWDEALAQRATEEPQWNQIDLETSLQARRQFDLDLFEPFLPVRSEWRSVVARWMCPALLMRGTDVSRGRIITSEIAQEAESLCPTLRTVAIEGAGHHLRYDSCEQYLAAVMSFLKDI